MPKSSNRAPKLKVIPGGRTENNRVNLAPAKVSANTKVREENDNKRRLKIQKEGRLASNSLSRWSREIEDEDRKVMAQNMDRIIKKHRIKPSNLPWTDDYKNISNFRNALSRSRLSSPTAEKAKLTAFSVEWLRIIDYIVAFLGGKGCSVSKESLVGELVKGTRFHPSQQQVSSADKITEFLFSIGEKVSQENGLIHHYRESSVLRAKYFKNYGQFINEKPFLGNHTSTQFEKSLDSIFGDKVLWDSLPEKSFNQLHQEEWLKIESLIDSIVFGILIEGMEEKFGTKNRFIADNETESIISDILNMNVRTYFDLRTNPEVLNFSEKRICDLEESEWNTLIDNMNRGPDDFEMTKYYIEEWLAFSDSTKCITSATIWMGLSLAEIKQFPHSFLGLFNYNLPHGDTSRVIDPSDSSWCERVENGFLPYNLEQIFGGVDCDYPENFWDDELMFLVLFPDLKTRELKPYIYSNYDGPGFIEVTTDLLSEEDWLLLPFYPPGGDAVVMTPLEIISQDLDRIKTELCASAQEALQSDPYTNHEKETVEKINAALSSLVD
ncbi:MAG: hypothetical protein DRR42_13170 [Gammaproteobacteria bacterium]|nr:MAG: hypothetical protein DRR42_13170 [Gammaproteobacteria bacterium]